MHTCVCACVLIKIYVCFGVRLRCADAFTAIGVIAIIGVITIIGIGVGYRMRAS